MAKVVSFKISFTVPDNTSKYSVRDRVEKILAEKESVQEYSNFKITGMEVKQPNEDSFKNCIQQVKRQLLH